MFGQIKLREQLETGKKIVRFGCYAEVHSMLHYAEALSKYNCTHACYQHAMLSEFSASGTIPLHALVIPHGTHDCISCCMHDYRWTSFFKTLSSLFIRESPTHCGVSAREFDTFGSLPPLKFIVTGLRVEGHSFCPF